MRRSIQESFTVAFEIQRSEFAQKLAPGTSVVVKPGDYDSEDDLAFDPDNPDTFPINKDARKYEKHLALATTFHTCGICSIDEALKDCVLLSSLSKEIEASDLAEIVEKNTLSEDECSDSDGDSGEETGPSTVGPAKRVPKMALRGCHWGSTATVFSVLNDVHQIANILPRMPSINDWAIIRSAVDVASPPPVIDATDEDYEGLNDDMNGVSGEYGHVVNPNAPPSNISDVFLQYSDEHQDTVSQVQRIIAPNARTTPKCGDHRRPLGEYARDYETSHFLQLAFVSLFPYGRGGPEPLGRNREFQQSPGFIFYAYSFVMKQKSGTISFLATKNGQEDKDPVKVSVADAKEFIAYIEANKNVAVANRPTAPADLITETKMRLLLNRLLPYATLLVGTELYMKAERRKRVEFQERGTPHSHNLINIRIKPDGVSEDSLTKTPDRHYSPVRSVIYLVYQRMNWNMIMFAKENSITNTRLTEMQFKTSTILAENDSTQQIVISGGAPVTTQSSKISLWKYNIVACKQ
eukprot:gene21593-27631_t